MTETIEQKRAFSLEKFLRDTFKNYLDIVGGFLNRIGLKPNTVTILGLIGNFIAAILLAFGHFALGGIAVIISSLIDTFDGSMARLRGEPTAFGGFVDSVSDRYSESVVLAGLMIHYLISQDWLTCFAIYLAITGSLLVSYVKARADAAGYDAKVGWLTRLERILVLAPALIFNIPQVGIWIVAIFSQITSLQRISFVRRQAYDRWRNNHNDKNTLP